MPGISRVSILWEYTACTELKGCVSRSTAQLSRNTMQLNDLNIVDTANSDRTAVLGTKTEDDTNSIIIQDTSATVTVTKAARRRLRPHILSVILTAMMFLSLTVAVYMCLIADDIRQLIFAVTMCCVAGALTAMWCVTTLRSLKKKCCCREAKRAIQIA